MTHQDFHTPARPPTAGGDAAAIAARIDRIPPGRFHVRLASMLGTGTFFDGFDALSIAVVLPLVVRTFHIGLETAGLIVSAGYLGQWVGALVVGALADRIGRRRAYVLSLLIFGVLSLGCAFAWSANGLLALRALQGLGLGAEVPIAGTLMNEYLSQRNRGTVSVIYQSLFPWGILFAPLIALVTTSSLGPDLGWRVLLVIGALPIVAAVWAWFALPESARWLADRNRTAEADAIVRRMEDQAAARGVELRAPEPAEMSTVEQKGLRLGELFVGIYRRRTLMVAVLWFTSFFVGYGYLTWLPTMYVSIGGLPSSLSLALTLAIGAIQLVGLYLAAWLIDRVGRRPLLTVGFGLGVVGGLYGLAAIGLLGYHTWPVLFIGGALLAVGMTIPNGTLYMYTGELYPTRMRGWATSAGSSLNRAASILSPLIFAFMLGGHGGAGAVFTAMGVAAAVGLVAVVGAGVETRNRSLEELSQ